MAEAIVECLCRLCLEFVCQVTCAVAYGLCGVTPRESLMENELELYVGKPPPDGGDCGAFWCCSSTRVLIPESTNKRALRGGLDAGSLLDLGRALDEAYRKGGVVGGLQTFIASEVGRRWAASLDITLSIVPEPPVAVRVVLGPSYVARKQAATARGNQGLSGGEDALPAQADSCATAAGGAHPASFAGGGVVAVPSPLYHAAAPAEAWAPVGGAAHPQLLVATVGAPLPPYQPPPPGSSWGVGGRPPTHPAAAPGGVVASPPGQVTMGLAAAPAAAAVAGGGAGPAPPA